MRSSSSEYKVMDSPPRARVQGIGYLMHLRAIKGRLTSCTVNPKSCAKRLPTPAASFPSRLLPPPHTPPPWFVGNRLLPCSYLSVKMHGEYKVHTISCMKESAWRTGRHERSMKRGSDMACMTWSPGFHHETQNRMSGSRALKFESQNAHV